MGVGAHTLTHTISQEHSAPYLGSPPLWFPSLEGSSRLDLSACLCTLSQDSQQGRSILPPSPPGTQLYVLALITQLRAPPDLSFNRRTHILPGRGIVSLLRCPPTLNLESTCGWGCGRGNNTAVKLLGDFRKLKAAFTLMRKLSGAKDGTSFSQMLSTCFC